MSEENKAAEPLKKYYIAYFDLLGYKQFFKSYPDKTGDFLNIIHKAIRNTKDYVQRVNSSVVAGEWGQLAIQAKVFSDNILLCLKTGETLMEYVRFLTFMSIVADIQRNFILQHGLFLRGGITIGTLSFNDDYIFGQGLIDSVVLEEAAIYPRIIIGRAALDYILQPHFIKQADLKKACEIEDRAHAGDQISDEELAFCNSILPSVNMEKFYLEWRNHLVFRTSDGEVILNYLYCFDINSMIDKTTMEQLLQFLKVVSPSDYQVLTSINLDQKPRLEQHKILLTQKVNEFGKYDNLDISAVKKAEVQEHILKKYLWALSFHNYVCEVYRFPDCVIRPYIGCDVRFMRMTAEILEDKST